MWNLFRAAREREDQLRAERQLELQAFLTAISAMTAMTTEAFKATAAQNEAFKTFLEGFKVTEPPQIREFDDVADLHRQMARYQQQADADLPPALRGLARADQFAALLDRLEAD